MKTMNLIPIALLAAAFTLGCTLSRAGTDPARTAGAYATVNGVTMYYEIHGAGRPLILLHGGLMTIDMFGPLLPALARDHQVIAVELQGHGHTADVDRPLAYEQLADDVAGLVAQLRLDHPDVMGFSLGGDVAVQLGIRHPDAVRKLVIVSSAIKTDGWAPEIRAGMASMRGPAMIATPMYAAYKKVAPRPAQWPAFIDKVRTLLTTPYDWTAAVATIKAPTLIVVGDADAVRLEHAVEIVRALPGARLAVVPGASHFTILGRVEVLRPITASFLE